MPLEYSIDPSENLIRTRCYGDFTFAEVITHSERVNSDELFRPGMNTLSDFREARFVGNVAEMSQYVEHSVKLYEVRGRCKWAILVGDEDFIGLVGIFDLVAKQRGIGIETRGFWEERAALYWLRESREAAKQGGREDVSAAQRQG